MRIWDLLRRKEPVVLAEPAPVPAPVEQAKPIVRRRRRRTAFECRRAFSLTKDAVEAMKGIPTHLRSEIVSAALVSAAKDLKGTAPPIQDGTNWVSVRAAAKLAGVTPMAIYQRVQRGAVRSIMDEQNGRLIDLATVAPRHAKVANGHA